MEICVFFAAPARKGASPNSVNYGVCGFGAPSWGQHVVVICVFLFGSTFCEIFGKHRRT